MGGSYIHRTQIQASSKYLSLMTFILKGIGDLATNTKPEHVLRSVSGAQQEIWWLVEWCWRSLAPIYSPSPKYTNAPLHLASSPFFVFDAIVSRAVKTLWCFRETPFQCNVRIGCVTLLANHHHQQQHTKPEHDGTNSTPLPGKRDVAISSVRPGGAGWVAQQVSRPCEAAATLSSWHLRAQLIITLFLLSLWCKQMK